MQSTMHRYNGPTIPEEGLYAGKLYTEEERAEIKRRACLSHGRRMQENQQDEYTGHRLYIGISVLIFIVLAAMAFVMPIVENAALIAALG
jgi:hypothetical protein